MRLFLSTWRKDRFSVQHIYLPEHWQQLDLIKMNSCKQVCSRGVIIVINPWWRVSHPTLTVDKMQLFAKFIGSATRWSQSQGKLAWYGKSTVHEYIRAGQSFILSSNLLIPFDVMWCVKNIIIWWDIFTLWSKALQIRQIMWRFGQNCWNIFYFFLHPYYY